jgi:serine/threonine-protein kinase
LRLVFTVGALVAVAAHVFYVFGTGLDPEIDTPFAPHIVAIYDLYLVSVGLGALLLYMRRWSLQALLALDYTIVTFCILLSLFISVVFDRSQIPIFAISILFFLHAAFVPVPVRYQVGLALTAVLGWPLIAALIWAFVPGIREHWMAGTGPAGFRAPLWEGTFQIAILGAISVVFSKILYHMRRSLHAAERVGSYVIERELGSGGMGRVFVAQHSLMCRPSAVKVIQAAPGEDPTLTRFEREVQLSATLSHPNTITVYDFGRTGQETFFYAMEYLAGMDLHRLVERFGPVDPERAVFILDQVCGSLVEAHAKDIIHRDIKSSNIFLTQQGGLYDFVKVLDFGLAKRISPDISSTVTAVGEVMGTPAFLAPEAAAGMERVDARSDIYSLGCVAYWLLAGKLPFLAPTSVEMIARHVQEMPLAVGKAAEVHVPENLDRIVMRCMEKDPAARFASVNDLQTALLNLRSDVPWTHERAREWWELHCPDVVAAVDASGSGAPAAG